MEILNCNNKWESINFICKNKDFNIFWEEFLKKNDRKILFILGKGFDHRMCIGLEKILGLNFEGKLECLLIEYNEGVNSPSHKHDDLIIDNYNRLIDLIKKNEIQIKEEKIEMVIDDLGKKRTGPQNIRNLFTNPTLYQDYSDILIDISAIPYSLYFPIIQILLKYVENFNNNNVSKKNLFVLITESSKYDISVHPKEVVKAQYMLGLEGDLKNQSKDHIPKIWIPILGEQKTEQYNEISSLITPKDICYILPFPSKNPRRGDDIYKEFKEVIKSKDQILYAAEQDPFDVYRIILATIRKYEKTLALLEGCQFVISPLSSKILSLGALLAVYSCHENNKSNVGIAYTEAKGYNITDKDLDNHNQIESEHFAIWLEGECYYE